MKVAYNECCGNHHLSEAGTALYQELGGTQLETIYNQEAVIDPIYIEVIERLGKEACNFCPPDIIEIADIDLQQLSEQSCSEEESEQSCSEEESEQACSEEESEQSSLEKESNLINYISSIVRKMLLETELPTKPALDDSV